MHFTRQAIANHLNVLAAAGWSELPWKSELAAAAFAAMSGQVIGEHPIGASNTGKVLYNPRALPIRFAWDPSIGLKITTGAVTY
jgi:hypothetical protein